MNNKFFSCEIFTPFLLTRQPLTDNITPSDITLLPSSCNRQAPSWCRAEKMDVGNFTKAVLLSLGLLFVLSTPLQGECQSCILRRQAHNDDLSQVGYYEDSSYFNSAEESYSFSEEDDEERSLSPSESHAPSDTERE